MPRKTLLAMTIAVASALPLRAETNFDSMWDLDQDDYRGLVQARRRAVAARHSLRSTLLGLQAGWERLGQTAGLIARIEIAEGLIEQMALGLARAQAYQLYQTRVRRRLIETQEHSGARRQAAPDEADVVSFRKLARVFGDAAFPTLPALERRATDEVLTLNQAAERLQAQRRQAALASANEQGISGDLLAVYYHAELEQMVGQGVERLLATLLGALSDWVERELEPSRAPEPLLDGALLQRLAEAAERR